LVIGTFTSTGTRTTSTPKALSAPSVLLTVAFCNHVLDLVGLILAALDQDLVEDIRGVLVSP
jgi:hypothetical protein